MDTLDAQLQNPLHFESPGRPVLVDRRSVNATASPPGERARLDNDDRGSSLDVGEDEEGVSPDVWGFKTGERFKTSLKEGWTIFIHHSVENVQAVLCEFTPGDPATYDVKQGVKHDFEAVKMVNRWSAKEAYCWSMHALARHTKCLDFRQTLSDKNVVVVMNSREVAEGGRVLIGHVESRTPFLRRAGVMETHFHITYPRSDHEDCATSQIPTNDYEAWQDLHPL